MRPFDLFVIETGYLTAEDCLLLFFHSLAKYGARLRPAMRVVLCINEGLNEQPDRRRLLVEHVSTILKGFNVAVLHLGANAYNKWKVFGWGRVNEPCVPTLTHGATVHEYLLSFGKDQEYTFLSHSDVEFTSDLLALITVWQRILAQNPKLAYISPNVIPADEKTKTARCMNSWFSLWKTAVLREYTLEKGVPFYAVDRRKEGGYFYDTGAFLQECVHTEFHELVWPVCHFNHWCGLTSNRLVKAVGAKPHESLMHSEINVRNRLKELYGVTVGA